MSTAIVDTAPKPRYRPPLRERLRVRWEKWKCRAVGKAVRTLSKALQDDPGFRTSWHANIAMPIYDSTNGKLTIHECNAIADKLMKHLFEA